MTMLFDTVLVANRGEIAVRVMRTLRALGIRSVAVFSDADAGARHVREADEAVRIGPAAAALSYLDVDAVVRAAVATGAGAIHPGYGFLSENARFAAACAEAGITFVGPPVSAIAAMGDKIRAKETVARAGVPVVPGRHDPGMTDDDLVAAAAEIGFPVLLKPSAGGGGKGMRRVVSAAELPAAIESARREARGAFGDDTMLLERWVERPRHVEIQVLGDAHGTVVHLGERECSLQRRHQKVMEEAPSPVLGAATREAMGTAAVEAARAVGYVGAGTVEFIVPGDAPEEFFFLEMNTRLQVEHPVTELVTGVDLVEWQLRVAAGEPLGFGQADVRLDGHAVEARVYAEDPARGFLPTGGPVLALREPRGAGIRVDSGLREGGTVGHDYDPMLAKVVAWGPDRDSALRRLDAALRDMLILGVRTNVGFLRRLLADADVRAGRLDTGLIDRMPVGDTVVPDHVLVAAGLERLIALTPSGDVVDPWDVPSGWRPHGRAWATWRVRCGDAPHVDVAVRGTADDASVRLGDAEPVAAAARLEGERLVVTVGGDVQHYLVARDGDVRWFGHDGEAWALVEQEQLSADRSRSSAGAGPVRSPMPGAVIAVGASVGDEVVTGQPLVTVEAMKMEHTLTAPVDGILMELHVRVGQQVRMDEVVAVVAEGEGS